MEPNAIPDISPTITHHGVLTVAEENSQLEDLAPLKRCRCSNAQYPVEWKDVKILVINL
jgi:hypothetical protein